MLGMTTWGTTFASRKTLAACMKRRSLWPLKTRPTFPGRTDWRRTSGPLSSGPSPPPWSSSPLSWHWFVVVVFAKRPKRPKPVKRTRPKLPFQLTANRIRVIKDFCLLWTIQRIAKWWPRPPEVTWGEAEIITTGATTISMLVTSLKWRNFVPLVCSPNLTRPLNLRTLGTLLLIIGESFFVGKSFRLEYNFFSVSFLGLPCNFCRKAVLPTFWFYIP